MKPVLRWAGSKIQHLDFLEKFWTEDNCRYVEPFAGSAALYFRLQPNSARLSDINKELIDTYKQIKKSPILVYKELNRLPLGEKAYYAIRIEINQETNPTSKAAKFIYLNRFCFNGLYRTNKKGEFNVPFGRGGQGKLPSEKDLLKYSESLQKITLKCEDYKTALKSCEAGDFVYIDPPYASENKRIFSQYNASSFGISDIEDLKKALISLDSKGVRFILSYAYEQSFTKEFSNWKIHRRYSRRWISAKASTRKRVCEAFVTNITR